MRRGPGRTVAATVLGACLCASAASGQGVMTFSWALSDTGNGDGFPEPGESVIATLFAEMAPGQTGFAGSIYDITGEQDWIGVTVDSFDNLLDSLTDDGQLQGDNSITGIESFQLPPLFNPNFDASNPIALYELVFTPALGWDRIAVTTTHINADVYTDDFGSSESYDIVVNGFEIVIPAPGVLGLLGITGLIGVRRRR